MTERIMCVCALIFCFMIATSFGFNSPSYLSSVMDGQRPILRYGGDEEDETERPPPVLRNGDNDPNPKTEPPWVSQLRSKIIKAIKVDGSYDNARGDIQKLIAATPTVQNADNIVNQPQASPGRSPLLPDDSIELDPQLPSDRGPIWLRKLKNSVKDLMKTYEKEDMNKLVEPIVERVQDEYDIDIEGIDVDPYGEVDVIYKSKTPEVTTEAAIHMPPYGAMPPGIPPGPVPPAGMPQGIMPPGGMRQGIMPPGGMGPGGMPPAMMAPPYADPYFGLRRMQVIRS